MPRPTGFGLFLTLLGLLSLAAAAWYAVPIRDSIDQGRVLGLCRMLRNDPAAILYVVVVYLIGGLVSFPIFILIPATAMVFGILAGACYSAAGLMSNALLLYGLGHFLGHDAIQRLGGTRMHRISLYLARRGLLTIAVLRFLPVAPYTIVNLAAGASHIRFREYALGTMLGISPAILIMTFAGHELSRSPVAMYSTEVALVMTVVSLLLVTPWLKRVWCAIRFKKQP